MDDPLGVHRVVYPLQQDKQWEAIMDTLATVTLPPTPPAHYNTGSVYLIGSKAAYQLGRMEEAEALHRMASYHFPAFTDSMASDQTERLWRIVYDNGVQLYEGGQKLAKQRGVEKIREAYQMFGSNIEYAMARKDEATRLVLVGCREEIEAYATIEGLDLSEGTDGPVESILQYLWVLLVPFLIRGINRGFAWLGVQKGLKEQVTPSKAKAN